MDDDEARELMEKVAAAKQEGRDIDRWIREKGGAMGSVNIGADFNLGWDRAAALDRALAALWRISMTAEKASVDDPPWLLPNQIRHLANVGMGEHRQRAQELAAGEPDG